jgi:large subunit ribosomal protein L21
MYAVIPIGGKQARVEVGSTLDVELLGVEQGSEVQFSPLLVVDGDEVLATAEKLGGASVTGVVLGESKGPKVTGFTYQAKARRRRRYGHRQHYSAVEITAISPAGAASGASGRSS